MKTISISTQEVIKEMYSSFQQGKKTEMDNSRLFRLFEERCKKIAVSTAERGCVAATEKERVWSIIDSELQIQQQSIKMKMGKMQQEITQVQQKITTCNQKLQLPGADPALLAEKAELEEQLNQMHEELQEMQEDDVFLQQRLADCSKKQKEQEKIIGIIQQIIQNEEKSRRHVSQNIRK